MNTYICLENIRSLYNIGAIFRTCSFYGINEVILLGYSGKTHDTNNNALLHPQILKTSLGSEKDLNITMLAEYTDLITFAKKNNLKIISIEQTPQSKNIHEYKDFENSIVIFGNEATGVTPEVLNASNAVLEIVKKGVHNSLNVTTTCGIVLDIIKNLPN